MGRQKVIAVGHGGMQCDSIGDVPWLNVGVNEPSPDDAARFRPGAIQTVFEGEKPNCLRIRTKRLT